MIGMIQMSMPRQRTFCEVIGQKLLVEMLVVPWPSIEPHGSRPSFTPRRLAAARTAFVRAEIIPA
jgi:hypothetical protein